MKKLLFFILSACSLLSCTTNQEREQKDTGKSVSEIQVINQGNLGFTDYFENKTMRFDFFHTGNSQTEYFAIDKILSDGIWSGSFDILIDELELGPYFFQVIDKESNKLLFSRGFANIFGEWQTIPEAAEVWGTFHESLRFPWPKKPITLIIKKRDANNQFKTIWFTSIDPQSRQVNPADIVHTEKTAVLLENGPSNEKLDIVILGDGYSVKEMTKFNNDAKRLSNVLLSAEPFNSRKNDINIRLVETPAQESGIHKPHPGVYKRTPLSAHYGSFDSERYVLSYDNKTIRNVASAVPYDFMVILVNERTYGGGGIYNLYTTVSSDNKFADYIMIHEMGHHMAALADEYYTSSVSYEAPPVTLEPWETNITAFLDKENLKWKNLVTEGTPLPTPWNKVEFDNFGYQIQHERDSLRAAKVPEEVMEALFMRQHNKESEYFSKEQYKDAIGAFEGAGYNQYGLYRSQLDCIMYTRHNVFCKVCQQSISKVIDQYSK